jgi:hypothetical protein
MIGTNKVTFDISQIIQETYHDSFILNMVVEKASLIISKQAPWSYGESSVDQPLTNIVESFFNKLMSYPISGALCK